MTKPAKRAITLPPAVARNVADAINLRLYPARVPPDTIGPGRVAAGAGYTAAEVVALPDGTVILTPAAMALQGQTIGGITLNLSASVPYIPPVNGRA